jgi:hypothetical protein
MTKDAAAPKTINRRISSLSSLYKFLAGAAAELRLPITVPNPLFRIALLRGPQRVIDVMTAQSVAPRRTIMKTFTIDNDNNNITAFASAEEAAATTTTPFDSFASQQELAELVAGVGVSLITLSAASPQR